MTDAHGKTRYSASVGKPARPGNRLYDSRRWRKLSSSFLGKPGNGLCAACLGLDIVSPATEVDHIQPHRGDPALFWDEDNWQGLCAQCHGLKTSIETRGVAQFPTVAAKPGARVVLVAGAPGSGRLCWAREHHPGARVIDRATIAAGWQGSERGMSDAHYMRAAQAEVHRQLRELAQESFQGTVVVIIDCHSHMQRREWKKRLQADQVVVLDRDPGTPVAVEWWSRYTSDMNETVVRV